MENLRELINIERYQTRADDQQFNTYVPRRPSLRKTRAVIDNEFIDSGYGSCLGPKITAVYLALTRHANYQTQECFPSAETLSKEAGIKNRNSIFFALKALEAYQIISVKHSKGKYPNRYTMLDTSSWKAPNSIDLDTLKKTKTVSKQTPNPYHNPSVNSLTVDTRSNINKLSNEIEGQDIELERYCSMLKSFYAKEDVVGAYEQLKEEGKDVSYTSLYALLKEKASTGKINALLETT